MIQIFSYISTKSWFTTSSYIYREPNEYNTTNLLDPYSPRQFLIKGNLE